MILIERVDVFNFMNAIRGARNAMNSWDRMDSGFDGDGRFVFGKADLELAVKLCKAGSSHRKFLRQIFVSADITAPLYWWKEYDTYKVGTVANSQSTMHRLHSRAIKPDDFSHDQMNEKALAVLNGLVKTLEELRSEYVKTKDTAIWYSLIQLLPSSYNQMRTCTMNYENLLAMHKDRANHKLYEWREFARWVLTLPYAGELICAL
jgi:hypothetical protein